MGCDDATKNAVQAHPQEIRQTVTPASQAANQKSASPVASGAMDMAHLPFNSEAAVAAVPLLPSPPSATEVVAKYAQSQFDAGQQEYQAGHLGAARHDFDASLDALLASGLDLDHDPQLSPLYHQILDAVSSEELSAFREGDGFTEQKAEVAPLDEIPAEITPEAASEDPDLASKAERELASVPHDLPLTVNEYVLAYLHFFQTPRGRAIIENGLRRMGRYRPMIEKVLKEEGLPQDLIYMSQAESAFQPVAVSNKQAVGLWQFVAARAREYGLQRTWWIDERQDPEKSTRAAARHLRDLYTQFNDWYLAMAAYDTGPGNVQKGIERTGYADFWELYKRNVLLPETKNYVPIILAMAIIGKDPQRYGIDVQPDPYIETDVVKPGHPIDLRLVAETIDVDVETLRGINPELLRMVTPASSEFELRLPAGTADRFVDGIGSIPPDKWVSWRRHRVEEGESIAAVARDYHVTAAAIADANGLDVLEPLEVGQKLIIPAAARSDVALGKLTRYRVRRGDSIFTIADQFSVSAAEIQKWNHLSSEHISRGMVLRVYPGGQQLPSMKSTAKNGKTTAPATASAPVESVSVAPVTHAPDAVKRDEPVTHKVQAGETLWSIARAYKTTADALREANKFLFTRPLRVGDQLVILPAH
jgi:membrane-bound lytic murein transglycosylase D